MQHLKRFADAELAAEFWKARGDQRANLPEQGYGWGGIGIQNSHIVDTLERFATTPSYDEADS